MNTQSLLSVALYQISLSPIRTEESEAIKELSDIQRRILKLTPNRPGKINTKQVSEQIGITIDHARYHLAKLREKSLVDFVLTDKKNQPAMWSRY